MISRKDTLIIGTGSILLVAIILSTYFWNQQQNSVATESMDVTELREQAAVYYKNGNYADTIKMYEQILEIEPNNAGIYADIAHTYRYWSKYEEAETFFLKAIVLSPNDAFLYTDLGKLYRNMGEYEKAEEAFHKSISIDPTLDSTYSYGLGYLYLEMQKYEQSEEMFLKAKELNPTGEMVFSGLGDLYREMGRYEESYAMYEKAFEINPDSESYLGLGWLYMYQEKYQEAADTFSMFLTNIREKAEVYYALGAAYEGMGNFPEAKKAYARSVELNPGNELFETTYSRFVAEHP